VSKQGLRTFNVKYPGDVVLLIIDA